MALENVNVTEVLMRIESGEIALPDIQREFVWDNVQVRDLIASIYKKHPIGMILIWEIATEDIPTEYIESNFQGGNIRYLVIDGQQRLSSLLFVKKGKLEKAGKARTIELYFNPLKEEFQLGNPKIRNKPDWFNVTEVINEESLTKIVDREKLKETFNLEEEEIYKKVFSRLEAIKSIFLGDRTSLPLYKIPSNFDYEEITDIFIKINSKGTRIRITELLLALLSLKLKGKFKGEFRDFLNELEGKDWNLDASVVIRSLVAIAASQGRLRYFKNIADKISPSDLESYWARTKESILHCLKILEENMGIRTLDIVPSQNVLVPLIYFLDKKQNRLSEDAAKKFIVFFLLASYWGRYVGPTETRLDEDLKSIKETGVLNDLFKNIKDQVGRLFINEDDFIGKERNKKLLLFVVSKYFGAEDWFKGHKITTSDIQEHHIFPRSLLKKKGVEISLIDDVANIAFLTEKANKTISNKEPVQYFIEEKIDEEKLKRQFVPMERELWALDRYEEFLLQRRKLVVEGVNRFLTDYGLES